MREITRDLNRLAATEDGFKIQRAMPNDRGGGRERRGRVGSERGLNGRPHGSVTSDR